MLDSPDERFRLIAEAVSEVFWIYSADRERIFYVSPAYERIWKRSCESLYENPRSWLDAIVPEDRAKLETNRARQGPDVFEVEYRITTPDGEVRWICSRGYPIRDASGEHAFYVGAAQDITERRRAEAEARTMSERHYLASRATNDGLWDWDIVANTAWWNDAMYEMQGLDPATTSPSFEAWVERVHPEDRDRVLVSFQRAIERGETTWSEEYRLRWPDGSIRELYDRAYVACDANGRPIRMVGAAMDLTKRRTLEAQVRHAQRMEAMGQLAGGIAHDFNNILQTIILELELQKAVPGVPARAREMSQNVRAAADRASSLTSQLLVFSRREVMRPRPLDLNAAIVDVMKMLRRIIGEDITLQLALSAKTLAVRADPTMLDQIVLNLAVNARDAMTGGGTLAIETSRVERADGSFARLRVRDTGRGIPPDLVPRIFEPFFTTKEPGHGTGLGLATVFGIVQEHRGTIEVASEPGVGTTFDTYLPLTSEALEASAPPVRERKRGSETILLVEDDDQVRRAVRELLEMQGYRVVEADRGSAALTAWDAQSGRIDLVLTDLVMPGGMDGTELASRLAARRPDLKIIFATGHSRDLALGERPLLRKPITADRLLGAVRECLDAQ